MPARRMPSGTESRDPTRVRHAILAVAAYRGFVEAIPGTSAAFVAESFALDEPALARVMAWVALASAGAVFLGRLFDVRGRRPVLVACVGAVPALALATAVSPSLAGYLAAQIPLFALVTAILAGAGVVIAETIPDARRAAALAHVGLADAVGGGLAILAMPIAAELPGTWRWLWWLAVIPVAGLGALRRAVPETPHFERRDALVGLKAIFASHRGRALHLVGALTLIQVAFGGLLFWPYYHAVEEAALSPALASAVVIVGGGVSLIGWVVGGRLAERIGRRLTAFVGTLGSVAAGAAYYLAGEESSAFALCGAYALFLGTNALALLATQTATLELFPTEVRASAATAYAALAASGAFAAQLAAAALATPLGGLSAAVAALGLLAVPGVLWFALALPETRGGSLGGGASTEAGR